MRSLVECVHDSHQVKTLAWEIRAFSVGNRELCFSWELLSWCLDDFFGTILVWEHRENILEEGYVIGQETSHVNHFQRSVNTDDHFGVGKGILQSTSRNANATTHVEDSWASSGFEGTGLDHSRELSSHLLDN